MKKNGKVELWRFIFSMMVLCFHVYKYLPGERAYDGVVGLSFFSRGYIGVEFFFVLSGILMAYSVYNADERSRSLSLGRSTTQFLKRKISSLMPMHLAVFVLLFAVLFFLNGWTLFGAAKVFLKSIPGLFFLQMSGIYGSYINHIEWYISVMLISMLILYPLLRKWYSSFTRIIAPITAIFILGYLSHTYNSLGGVKVWTEFGSKAMLRGLSEIALGTVCFEASRCLSQKEFGAAGRALITAAEAVSLVAAIALCVVTRPAAYDFYALAFIAVALTCAFTGKAYGSGLFQNRFCAYLGKLSLPIYLVQLIPIKLVPYFAASCSMEVQMLLTVIASLLLAAAFAAGNDAFFKWRRGKAAAAALG